MRFVALACDYDSTLAEGGVVTGATVAALRRARESGRQLILVTGRELEELLGLFPQVRLFDRVVAENGALLYDPATERERILAEPPPEALLGELRRRGVRPLSAGRVIISTHTPHETAVLEAIRDLGLEHHVIFNKGAVMILPSDVSKATGLAAALRELRLSARDVVAVGDAENDHVLLAMCECGVAVANALPSLKARADLVTAAPAGEGVVELIDELVRDDLAGREDRLARHHVLLGVRADGARGDGEVRIPPYGESLLIAGPSAAGKSTIATAFLERLTDAGYQCCVIDPEGDYAAFEGAAVLGVAQRAPSEDEVLKLLEDPERSAVVNLVGQRFEDRPEFFRRLLARLQDLRSRTGRPHWIVIDEAHHVAPASQTPVKSVTPVEVDGLVMITVEPRTVAPALLSTVTVAMAVSGAGPLAEFCGIVGCELPALPEAALSRGQALALDRRRGGAPFVMRVIPGRADRRRHVRKYAEGELPPDRSFYFRGPEGRLNLRAQNLILFRQIADGIDDQTWMYHLRRGDYSSWLREQIKDESLADEVARVEKIEGMAAAASRQMIRGAIERRYTLPTSGGEAGLPRLAGMA